MEQYEEICKSTGKGRVSASQAYKERPYDIKVRLLADFQQLVTLSMTTKLTIPAIKTMIIGKSSTDSFLNIWETVSKQKSIGTCANYLAARNSFIKYIGNRPGFNISTEDLKEWDVDWRENTHYSLGLFLVQYLGNGFNLADAAHLTYNDHYFQSGKKSFQFVRQKTEDRSDNEVVIPIIPPLQTLWKNSKALPLSS